MQHDNFIKRVVYKALQLIPDSVYVRLKYRKAFGRWPDLRNPRSFNEKLTWLKLHDRNPLYTAMVDKYEAKRYVAGIIGDEYIIPTYGVWDRAEDIDFDALPDKFVLKATHDSGRVIICRDKSTLDRQKAIREMRLSLRRNFYAVTREWPYKNVKPRIIAEKLLEVADNAELADYKVHNFNGVPKVILVCRDRFRDTGLTEDFFDSEWKHLDVRRPGHPNAPILEDKPEELDKMLELSERLSKSYPFMRTDFYSVGGKVYFGEITLYPASAAVPFVPESFDDLLGKEFNVTNLMGEGKILTFRNMSILIRLADSSTADNSINDYKFFCFNGRVKFMKVDLDRSTEHRANYYDRDFRLLEFGEVEYPPDFARKVDKPACFKSMIELAEKIARKMRFVRVDFYEIDKHVFFGEITFYPSSAAGRFTVPTADLEIGKLLKL